MEDFMAITGLKVEEEALHWLSSADFNVPLAVELYFSSNDKSTANDQGSALPIKRSSNVLKDDNESFFDVRQPYPVKRQRLLDLNHITDHLDHVNHTKHTSAFSSGNSFVSKNSKDLTLMQLYQPPNEIITAVDFDEAKAISVRKDKWLLVNIQDEAEFACHILNRDFWKSEDIKDIISCSFVFWQQLNISSQGELYMQRYKVKSFPYVAILDPQTGAKQWCKEGKEKATPSLLGFAIQDFLADHPAPSDMDRLPMKKLSLPTALFSAAIQHVSHSINQDSDGNITASKEENFGSRPRDEGFSAEELLTRIVQLEDKEEGVEGRAVQFRLRCPWGQCSLSMNANQSAYLLLAKIAGQIPTQDKGKRFDITYGLPVNSFMLLLRQKKVVTGSDDVDLASIGLESNTTLNVRYL